MDHHVSGDIFTLSGDVGECARSQATGRVGPIGLFRDYSHAALNLSPLAATHSAEAISQEAVMVEWHDTMVERTQTDSGVYLTGWTISGLAVLGTIVAVWVLGI